MRSVEQIIEEQMQRWQLMRAEKKKEEEKGIRVITISREPGSGGRIVAERLAEKLGLELFHQEVLHEMAESANVSGRLVKTLDEKGMSVLSEWVDSLVDSRHLWPDQYLRHLMKVIGTIGRHGRAVMIGRGANFVLPPGKRFSVRVVSPRKVRVQNVSKEFGIPADEAERRVIRTESDRRAFVRKYFNGDIANPTNYDLVINTATLSIDEAVEIISGALGK
ncbi:cytidylate kinase-like family protein [Desulfobacterales bacterium HSG2]|nr:cytidylate kinase-like family protein [Desulfobacterales bacterium HSG2]